MALIKNAIARDLARDAVVLDLGDLQSQALVYVQQAQAQAQKIIADAQNERQRLVAGAAEKGHAEGLSRGIEEGRTRGHADALEAAVAQHADALAGVESAWATALSEFAAQREAMIEHATRDAVTLAVAVAEKVVKRSIAVDPGVVVEQLRAVLAVVVRPTELVVRIHPEDRPLVQRSLPALLAAMSMIRHAELADDPALDRGSCVARMRGDQAADAGAGGEIDASIQTQLDRIVEVILPGAQRPLVRDAAPANSAAEARADTVPATTDAAPAATPPGESERGEASW